MSKDSSFTALHLCTPSHPFLIESLAAINVQTTTSSSNRPPSPATSHQHHQHHHPGGAHGPASTSTATRIPYEEIQIPPHHQPLNPEDEDDVVPDQHAAFGIQQAGRVLRGEVGTGVGGRQEERWRDYGLDSLMRRGPRPGELGLVLRGDGAVNGREGGGQRIVGRGAAIGSTAGLR